MDNNHHNDLQKQLLAAIKSGGVVMRPKWHFILKTILIVFGIGLIFLTLLYLVSLSVFVLRDNGAWFAPTFGFRGWFTLLESLPWILISIALLCIVTLEILVKRYSFAYRRPVGYSLCGIMVIVFLGGLVIASGPFDRRIFPRERGERLAMNEFFGRHSGSSRPRDIYRVEVMEASTTMLIVADALTGETSTILIDTRTRLPFGADFAPHDILVIFGGRTSGTIRALGIQEISD